jgi:hypothetical protein
MQSIRGSAGLARSIPPRSLRDQISNARICFASRLIQQILNRF